MSHALAAEVLAWLATFALHATILVGIAALATRRLAERAPARAERIWVVALWAGLVTTSVQARTDFGPSWTLGSWARASAVAAPAIAVPVRAPRTDGVPQPLPQAPCAGESTLTAAIATPDAQPPVERFALTPVHVVTLWGLGAAIGLLALTARYVAFLRSLRDRRELTGPVADELARLARAAGIASPRLTVSGRLAAPASFMLPGAEICLPERALRELDADGRQAILAHELAHLVRRDPLRLLLWRSLEAVFFFQPLLRVARQRLVGLSETLCDEWAVVRTGGRRELARTLALVAGWVSGPQTAPVARMAACRSSLGRRVERLLRPVPVGAARTPTALATLGLLAVAITGPGIACQATDAGPSTDSSAGVEDARLEERALVLLSSFAADLDVMSAEITQLIDQVEQQGQAEPARRLRDLDSRLRTLRGRRDQLETTLSRMVTQP